MTNKVLSDIEKSYDTVQGTAAASIFNKHYEYYKNIGIETIKQQSGQVEQVSADYQGRVIFELLQNAFDKAEKNILVKVADNSLYVANDGSSFTYVTDFDYKNGTSPRGDFQSLCSISTSTKQIASSIGNKGVGFKSAFSIAAENYVNIFTQADIINEDGSGLPGLIAFRVYDSFKDPNSIDVLFETELKLNLKQKIEQVQVERKDRGVPGYYFPIQIPVNAQVIDELFAAGFVTVVQIPFSRDREESIKLLFKEIEKIHFQFVRLKYDTDFEITFDWEGQIVRKRVERNVKGLISGELRKEEIQRLAEKAGVKIDTPRVAFFIDENNRGSLFNYLPTRVTSPFKYVDFHADFQTKVDRTSINFNLNSDVGAYNNALLKACIELFFYSLKSSYDEGDKMCLKFKYIDESSLKGSFEKFDWSLLKLGDSSLAFHHVRDILSIWNFSYKPASEFLVQLAKPYFSVNRAINEHSAFFEIASEFVNHFGREHNQDYKWLDYFKKDLGSALIAGNVAVIPGVVLSDDNEVFFRKASDKVLHLPDFVNVSVTNFEVKDESLRKSLRIKDFNDYNEILKYFKQVSFTGEYSSDSLSEEQQIEMLKSIAKMMSNKNESIYSSTHRYARVFTSESRRNNSAINQAYFSISTVFLKTVDGNYKPSQLCRRSDVDDVFLGRLELGDQLNEFLRFIGVSLDDNYIFADKRIFDKLNDGLDYIPRLINRHESDDKLFGEALLNNIRVISEEGEQTHPALINNNYSFLQGISGKSIKDELAVLKTDYEKFPKEYLEILYQHLNRPTAGVERLYPNLFHRFFEELKLVLISNKGVNEWVKSDTHFYVAKNRHEYNLLKAQAIPLLCYFASELPGELVAKQVTLQEGQISKAGLLEVTEEYSKLLNSRMPYLMASISNSSLSELNLKSDSSRVKDIQSLLSKTQVFECEELSQNIKCKEANLEFNNSADALVDKDLRIVYIKKGSGTKTKAELFSRYLFNNISIVSEFELIVFFKSVENLESDLPKEDVKLIKRFWITDYDTHLQNFQVELFDGLIDDLSRLKPHCLEYSRSHKSEIILEIFNSGKLYELETRLSALKSKYNGLFDDLDLRIDYEMNDSRISLMLEFLKALDDGGADLYMTELEQLSKTIGQEERLDEIEQVLREQFQFDPKQQEFANCNQSKKKLSLDRTIDQIFAKLPSLSSAKTSLFTAIGVARSSTLAINSKKLIFQDNEASVKNGEFLEQTGAKGEEQVLGYYIQNFLTLSSVDRTKAINEMYDVIEQKLGNDSHAVFRDACLLAITEDEALIKALISFCYIALHHKFSYFDLIVYKNGKPTMVEVKSTNSSNNDSFYISIAEVNEAISEENYEIVRVTPQEIIFMGNPIKLLEDKITSINGSNYRMKPRNFKFEFNRQAND
ncbi:sacsin N-terminal ATP-binding-like domain-containing protein [Desertivirga brevis]|uniref:sacsin N-terminal ATP-binding-like domain-containing protein n=1 Tax=Desertivirga brevis TaxID=2810310 RepID=UPI001A97409C|nr:DUF3883 domain-containing protein [Pedobacter sp. SYSU D00873]